MIGTFGIFIWIIGIAVLTSGLYNISIALRNRVWACALLGANLGLGCLLARPPPENWLSLISWTFGSFYIGMVGGLISDRKTFLLEDEDEKAAGKNKAP